MKSSARKRTRLGRSTQPSPGFQTAPVDGTASGSTPGTRLATSSRSSSWLSYPRSCSQRCQSHIRWAAVGVVQARPPSKRIQSLTGWWATSVRYRSMPAIRSRWYESARTPAEFSQDSDRPEAALVSSPSVISTTSTPARASWWAVDTPRTPPPMTAVRGSLLVMVFLL